MWPSRRGPFPDERIPRASASAAPASFVSAGETKFRDKPGPVQRVPYSADVIRLRSYLRRFAPKNPLRLISAAVFHISGGVMPIAVGQPAPDFTLKDQNQNDIKLSDLVGKR